MEKQKQGVSKKTACAIHIIEEVVEELMGNMAEDIRFHREYDRSDIIKELERGMEGEAYYEMEDKIISLLKKYL